ncbi:MAG: tRNA(Ile)-lysidine synthase [Planctomycetota bacterium]|jgi:tRNA(Ile)-lysidine synthase
MADLRGQVGQTPEQALDSCLLSETGAGEGLLVAVSGGVDSMVLLRVTADLASRHQRPLAAAHLNHNLRGAASVRDAELVRRYAEQLGVRLLESCLTAGELEADSTGSLEESARKARLKFLIRTAQEQQLPVVLTAHHAADQAETVLHNILRGTGLKGLRGIPVSRPLAPGVRVLRPLLKVSKQELQRFAVAHAIAFAVDETNADPRFTRNRIRHDLLPRLREQFNPTIEDALLRLAEQSGELLEIADSLADELLQKALLQEDEVSVRLNISELMTAPDAILRHAMVRLWDRKNWPRQQLRAAHWHRAAALVRSPGSCDFPGAVRLQSSGGVMRVMQVDHM